MPVLATSYRLPLTGMRNGDGAACAVDGEQTAGNWGVNAREGYEIAQGSGEAQSGQLQFIMPPNYLPGANFTITVALLDSEGLTGAELTDKELSVGANKLPLDGWNGSAGEIIQAASAPISSGGYTEYVTSTNGDDLATLSPGDLVVITVTVNWPTVTTPSVPVLLNVVVDIAP